MNIINFESMFHNYNKKILPLLLEDKELFCLDVIDLIVTEINSENLMSFLSQNIVFKVNPSFQSKVKFVKNLLIVDSILKKSLPDENSEDLLLNYMDFLLFTYNAFLGRSDLPIRNITHEPPCDNIKEIANPLNFNKRDKLLISALISLKSNPPESYNERCLELVLRLLLYRNEILPPEKALLEDTKNLNIIAYKKIITLNFDRDKFYDFMFDFWRNLPDNLLDKLFVVLDVTSLLGISTSEQNIFNSPVAIKGAESIKWLWLHYDFKNEIYSPLKVLRTDKDFVAKIKKIATKRVYSFFIKNSLVYDFKTFLEFKISVGDNGILKVDDFILFAIYEKINGFLIEKENLKHFKDFLLNEDVSVCINYIQKSYWSKKSSIEIYKELIGLAEKEKISKIINGIINYEILIETSQNNLKIGNYLNKEDFLFSEFKAYNDLNLIQDKIFFMFRMMVFAFVNQNIRHPKSMTEVYVKENFEEFYWKFLENYVSFMSNRDNYIQGVFSLSFNGYKFEFKGFNAQSRVVEQPKKELLNRLLNQDVIDLDKSEGDDDFKI